MGLRVNTNVASISAQRSLFNTTMKLGKSFEKLSSGLRINRAGDDAAGLAVSDSLRSEIRALGQASRNAQDGISMVQTAESALEEVSNILIRMKELSSQGASGTLTDTERAYLNTEFQALVGEITRISDTASFNGQNLLDGSAGSIEVQVGAANSANDRITLSFATDMDATALGVNASAVDTVANAQAAMDSIDTALDTVHTQRASFGSSQNLLESTVRTINTTIENLSAANSRVRDVDVAVEAANMTSLQILQQAGISVLAQANMSIQGALGLLG